MNDKLQLHWQNTQDLNKAISLLHLGNILMGSSDTVFGLFASVSPQGYHTLNTIKKRTDKPYLILLNNASNLAKYVPMPQKDWVTSLMEHYWPGPLTLILKAHQELPDYMKAADGTIAVRVPLHEGIRTLAARGGPLFSTSANLAGQPIPNHIQDISPAIMDKVIGVINDNQPPLPQPSTIVDCTGDFPLIVREGMLSAADIMLGQ